MSALTCEVYLILLCHCLRLLNSGLNAAMVDVSLAGYTVSSVIVGDWKKLYIAGAPRFKHKGKVILFQLTDYGDVTIVQALNGEQVKLSPSLPPPPSLGFIHL